jgi:hypothetical protein
MKRQSQNAPTDFAKRLSKSGPMPTASSNTQANQEVARMTTKNNPRAGHPATTDNQHNGNSASEPLTDEERDAIREYYRSLTFKELLAVCPIDGIDLMRSRELPRSTEL